MKKISIIVIVILAVVFVWTRTDKKELEIPMLTAKAVTVLDADTNKVVYSYNADERLLHGSLTKLMSIYLIYEAIENGEIAISDEIIISSSNVHVYGNKYGALIGEPWTLEQLIAGIVLASACDCVSGVLSLMEITEEQFVERMNEKAKEFKLNDTKYANATGLDSDNHYMSSNDIATLSKRLVTDFPEILELTSLSEKVVEGKYFKNTNILAGVIEGYMGLKTGTTDLSGESLCTYVQVNGKKYIIVVISVSEKSSRFDETRMIVEALKVYE